MFFFQDRLGMVDHPSSLDLGRLLWVGSRTRKKTFETFETLKTLDCFDFKMTTLTITSPSSYGSTNYCHAIFFLRVFDPK